MFELTQEDRLKVANWLRDDVYPKVIEKQKATIERPSPIEQFCWEEGYPYEGACGGGLTYCFTPTSLGTVTVVKYAEYELNLTDYGSW
jgi:hypothetical protein